MNIKSIAIALLTVAGALTAPAYAGDCCPDPACTTCAVAPPENFVEVGGACGTELTAAEELALDKYGVYPEGFLTSGRLQFSQDYFDRDRFELRWDDIHRDGGRGWARVALFPATLEADVLNFDNTAWNRFQDDPVLQEQQMLYRDLKLRFHDGELDNMLLRFTARDWQRQVGSLSDFEFRRLTYQYNFNLGCERLRGQFRQVGTAATSPRLGPGRFDRDVSLLKLDAELSDEWSAYGRGSYTLYDYEDLPDDEFDGYDYKVGLRYAPDCDWTLTGEYGAKQYPTDNTVGSHVESYGEYGVSASYEPTASDWYRFGYNHKTIDYTRLNVQDAGVKNQLRSGSVLTPADFAANYSLSTPERDELWFDGRHQFSERLAASARVSYSDGDTPGSDLVAAGSPSLFYDSQLSGSTRWTYNTARDEFSVSALTQESSNGGRDSGFDMSYLEGSWTRCVVPNGFLTMAVRSTQAALDTDLVDDGYSTDDMSYLLAFNREHCDFSYAIDLNYADGSGHDEYTQTGAGASVSFKDWGPLGLRVDWYDRNYAAVPVYNTQAVEFSVEYRIKF